ncbi:MAG: serine hydrolase domain-containing protein, partial [Bacteroidota bacterium]
MSTKWLIVMGLVAGLCSCQPTTDVYNPVYHCTGVVQDSLSWDGRVNEFQSALDWATSQGMPGVAAYLVTEDDMAWMGTSGYASLEEQVRLEPCHRMLVASVSKVFTATAIFQLVEAGQLSLDDPLGDYLEGRYMERIRNAKVVTIRQMLNHTSGLYDYLWPTKFELWSIQEPFHSAEVEDKLQLAYGRKPTHDPGATYSYSNTNYVLLGMLVEELSGQPLDEYLEAQVFGPLGLTSAYMGTVANPIPPGTPEGYLALQGSENLQSSAFY